MNKQFKNEVKHEKAKFYKTKIQDLKQKKPGQWYSWLKRVSTNDQTRDQMNIDDINHLSDIEQAEVIAEKFSSIQNEYEEIKKEDIMIPPFEEDDIPQFHPAQVWLLMCKLKTNKATVPGDFPAKLIKHFAAYLAEPFTDIVNTSIKRGEYPQIYKFETCTPVPKVPHQPQNTSQIRNISGLLNFDKLMEKLISEMIVSDMSLKMDQAQYGNQRGVSIQHYLINMIHRILTAVDKNSQKETFAVIANMIDWDNAFPRQCPTLGVKSFIQNGVRPALIPVLINYFQGRQMSVKWHGVQSVPRTIKGGGPQGATIGLLEFLSQSNDNANCVSESERFKFLDDLSVLEIINLLTVGLSSFNLKRQVASDIPQHNQFIPAENLRSQNWLNQISDWTRKNKMKVNVNKTKTMIFNYTDKYQFTTRLAMDNCPIEEIKSTKLLGTIITNDLRWDENCKYLIRKANMRMQLLHKVSSFGLSREEMKNIYILFIRSILEQSATVWHSSLSLQNREDLERVQKSAVRLILGNQFKGYKKALQILEMENLDDRRKNLCLRFAQKAAKHEKMRKMFPLKKKIFNMTTRHEEKYQVQHANTDRLRKSPIIYMQNLLNLQKS